MSAKKWIVMFLICILASVGIFALINYITDPYGVFGDKFFNWYSFNETYNPRVAKIQWLEDNYMNYDSYVVGCSSAASYPVELLNKYYNANFYNLFVYGCDMYDTTKISKYILEKYNVKNLVVNLGFTECETYMIDKEDGADKLHYLVDGTSKLKFYSYYLFKNLNCSYEKFSSYLNDTMLPQKFDVFDVQTGMYDKRVRDVENIGNKDIYLKNNSSFKDYVGYKAEMINLDNCLKEIKNIKEWCDGKDINVTFIFPPIYYKQISNYDKDVLIDYYTKVAEITDFWDFSMSSVSYEERYFYDETHFRNATGEMMFARIFEDSEKYYPDKFGIHITKDNINDMKNNLFVDIDSISDVDYATQVPIVLYHDIKNGEVGDYTITTKMFEKQIKEIVDNGYTSVSFDQMIDYVYKGNKLPEKPICITFDDGYLSNYEIAFPILKKYNVKATIFVIGVSVGSMKNYKSTSYPITPHFTYEQAKEMIDSGLISIQSHSYDMHQYAPYESGNMIRENFDKIKDESDEKYVQDIVNDFNTMNSEMKNNLNEEVYVLSYPNGKYNVLSEVVLRSLGVKATLSTEQGQNVLIKGLPQSLFAMKRYNIDSSFEIKNLLDNI